MPIPWTTYFISWHVGPKDQEINMKKLFVFIRKEFYHVFWDRRTLLILFGLPIVQIVLFGFALSSEVKNIGLAIQDNAQDVHSEQLIAKIGRASCSESVCTNV